jgi:hypothetical protein
LLIGGKWRDAQDGAVMNTSDPTTEEVGGESGSG